MFAFRDRHDDVDVAFTDRHGGVSAGSFASLNLALEGADDPDSVAENLRRVESAFGRGATYDMRQVHGADVAVVEDLKGGRPSCDGLVTSTRGQTLLVRVADCVPVLLADPAAGVVGAAHAGRKGLLTGVVPATVSVMRSRGASRLVAWIGPHICGRCYEVPEALREEAAAAVPESRAETSWGTPSIDLGAGIHAQLAALGVEVVDASRCTRESEDLYSYRRDGDGAGRFAGLIRCLVSQGPL